MNNRLFASKKDSEINSEPILFDYFRNSESFPQIDYKVL